MMNFGVTNKIFKLIKLILMSVELSTYLIQVLFGIIANKEKRYFIAILELIMETVQENKKVLETDITHQLLAVLMMLIH
jgi:hypothetical protein